MLCMKNFVVLSCDRPNIKHACIKAPAGITKCFSWLCSDLQEMKENTPKIIIYCRNIKTCGLIYEYQMSQIGLQISYIRTCSAKNCLFAMFHQYTAQNNKTLIMDTFRNIDCKLRVVIATTAFSMGVSVPDIRLIVNWGAPHSIQGYMQQSGRAGRNGNPSVYLIYYHAADISTVATDGHTR